MRAPGGRPPRRHLAACVKPLYSQYYTMLCNYKFKHFICDVAVSFRNLVYLSGMLNDYRSRLVLCAVVALFGSRHTTLTVELRTIMQLIRTVESLRECSL